MTQTEHRDIYEAPGETKFKFLVLQETPNTQQNAFNGGIIQFVPFRFQPIK